jgi:flagellar operon protein
MTIVNGIQIPFVPVAAQKDFTKVDRREDLSSFDSIFQNELEKIKFSNHALKRLENRNIRLDEEDLNKIQEAVNKAELKGSKDSLVMMQNPANGLKTAFIVNIPNRTVVTAIPVDNSEENIFTNIDSVVFA